MAQEKTPNILFIVSDDTGYGDLGPYGGGEGRGMPTPNIDKMAHDGMTFFSFYAQPSCTPGRASGRGKMQAPSASRCFQPPDSVPASWLSRP